jgi:methionyl-tRNA formyltransferase
MNASLRVLYCGTPAFAVPCLDALLASRHKVVGVLTVPDRPQGRGLKLAPSAVKRRALEHGLPVQQPERLDLPELLASVREGACDLLVVVAYRILPPELYSLPRLGAINLHASLLPAYRGAAPVQRAIMDGCRETGVTTFQITRKVDEGGVLLQRAVAIEASDNAGRLALRLAKAGAGLVMETLDGLASETLSPVPQNHALATRAPKITAEDRPIRWDQPAAVSHHRVRALAPRPGATIRRQGKQLKVLETGFDPDADVAPPGVVAALEGPRGIAVGTGRGTLYLREVQPEGRGAMEASAYLRGYPLRLGDRFE